MKTIVKCWTFASSSGSKLYQALLYSDGSTSCDCPGWCKRTAPDGSRSCKHTRSVLMGTADVQCQSRHDYSDTNSQPSSQNPVRNVRTKPFGQIGRRRIQA